MELAEGILEWGRGRRRDLPWRETREPWAVLVSEVMLQQTQVSRVEAHFHAFLEAFPTPAACAGAPLAEVIRCWDGLGYNRRAVWLHDAATMITGEHGGGVPDSLDALLQLPGVGPYTARAVLAFAFERDHGIVDTNAARVLTRAVAGRSLDDGRAQRLADRMVPEGRGWAYNQSILDFAAAVCRRRDPACGSCPLRSGCAWALEGWPEPDPASSSGGAPAAQSRFAGSDRQGRGRLVAALRSGPVPAGRIPEAAGWPAQPERAHRIAGDLVAEGLACYAGDNLVLPRD